MTMRSELRPARIAEATAMFGDLSQEFASEQFAARMDEVDRAVQVADWNGVLSAGRAALEIRPGDLDAEAMVRLAERRLAAAAPVTTTAATTTPATATPATATPVTTTPVTTTGANAVTPSSTPAGSAAPIRRQLTVMFCDVVGSTAIATSIDPELVREILLEYQAACAEIIASHDGNLARYLGDGLLVYFGYPVAHEDDARRAVLAGLSMTQRVAELAVGFRERFGVEFAIRVGIHTGLVVLGDVGTDRWRLEGDITGATPNLAARLESAAPTNGVALSEATRRLVEGFIDVESMGTRNLKGFAEPVEVFRAVSPTSASSRIEAATRLTPFVGRTAERAALVGDWQRAMSGESSARLIIGDAGMGKTRLLHWLRSVGMLGEGLFLVGQCSPYSTLETFGPVRRMVERGISAENVEDPEQRLKLLLESIDATQGGPGHVIGPLAELLGLQVPEGHEAGEVSPDVLRERFMNAVSDWIAWQARGGRRLCRSKTSIGPTPAPSNFSAGCSPGGSTGYRSWRQRAPVSSPLGSATLS